MQVKFKNWHCNIATVSYKGGALALVLNDSTDGKRIAVATANLPTHLIEPDHCFIKDYSENEGMLDALVKAGAVKDTGIRIPMNRVEFPLVQYLGTINRR